MRGASTSLGFVGASRLNATVPLGLDQEHRPAGSRELAAQRCQQGTILGLQPGPWTLATQDREFVTQREDLDFLGLSRSAAEHDQLGDGLRRSTAGMCPVVGL
jgi:hypothetical protein